MFAKEAWTGEVRLGTLLTTMRPLYSWDTAPQGARVVYVSTAEAILDILTADC